MMLRIIGLLLPVLMAAVGVLIYLWISSVLVLPKLNNIQIVCSGLIPAACELLVIRELPEEWRQLLMVDGSIFPFFSAGLCLGMMIV